MAILSCTTQYYLRVSDYRLHKYVIEAGYRLSGLRQTKTTTIKSERRNNNNSITTWSQHTDKHGQHIDLDERGDCT